MIAEPTFKKPLDQRRPSITQLATGLADKCTWMLNFNVSNSANPDEAQQLHGFENTAQKGGESSQFPSVRNHSHRLLVLHSSFYFKMYLTVRNFDGTQLQEFHALSVGKGEILTEIDPIPAEVTQIVNGWSKVKNQRGSIGFVPSPLLKQLNNSS